MAQRKRLEPEDRWCVEYRPAMREYFDELIAYRTPELAQEACDNLNQNYTQFGNEYEVVRYRRIPPNRKSITRALEEEK